MRSDALDLLSCAILPQLTQTVICLHFSFGVGHPAFSLDDSCAVFCSHPNVTRRGRGDRLGWGVARRDRPDRGDMTIKRVQTGNFGVGHPGQNKDVTVRSCALHCHVQSARRHSLRSRRVNSGGFHASPARARVACNSCTSVVARPWA